MKNVALVAALVLATTAASVRVAAACGGYGARAARVERASSSASAQTHGVWPRLEREGARTILTLSYPRVGDQGPTRYMDTFEVVRDRNLRRLERVLAQVEWPSLDVTIARVDGQRWRVVSWSPRA